MSLKRPGKIRFDYGRNANMLIVGDGRALTFIDYDARDVQRWPINDLAVGAAQSRQDLSRFARVTRDDAQVLMIEARDPRRREFGTITIAFAKAPGAPAGLTLQGWNVRDARTISPPSASPASASTCRSRTACSPIATRAGAARAADGFSRQSATNRAFAVHRGDRSRSLDMGLQLRELVRVFPRCPSCAEALTSRENAW